MMARLISYMSIVFILLMYVHIHHCKPIIIPAIWLSSLRSNEYPYPLDRQVCARILLLRSNEYQVYVLGTTVRNIQFQT